MKYYFYCLPFIALIGPTITAEANDRSILYDSLSLIEEPLAVEIGDVTFSLRGTIDVPVDINLKDVSDHQASFKSALQLDAETQLPNAMRLRGSYTASYDTKLGEGYDDKYSLSVGNPMGTIYIGKVSDVLRLETDSQIRVGNADLKNGTSLGTLDERSLAYLGMFGPVHLGGVIDEFANFELGASFQRPLGDKDHQYGLRYTDAHFDTASGLHMRSHAIQAMAELIYGSSTFSLAAGYEMLKSPSLDANRIYVSGGANRKAGPISVSLEGHIGQIEGQSEYSAALGAAYDFARGASLNLGLNYTKADIDKNNIHILKQDEATATVSLRYGF